VSTRKLWRWYRHDLALIALKNLKAIGIDVQLAILGGGEAGAELRQRAKDLGVSELCRFYGERSRADVITALADNEVYLSTVPSDGISDSLIEAIFCKLVPILPDIPANRFFTSKGVRAFLFNPGDAASLTRAITSCASERPRYPEITQINSEAIVTFADIRQNFESLVAQYRQLLAARASLPQCAES
jgi:glycosyltransferase involved in cell wall biosynthesis